MTIGFRVQGDRRTWINQFFLSAFLCSNRSINRCRGCLVKPELSYAEEFETSVDSLYSAQTLLLTLAFIVSLPFIVSVPYARRLHIM